MPRVKVTETTVYKFAELPPDIQQKALERLSYISVDFDWWDYVDEDAANIGLKITEFDIDRRSIDGHFTLSAEEVAANIISQHGEIYETHKTARAFLDSHDPIYGDYMDEASKNYESPALEQKLIALESEFLESLLGDYLKMLQDEYDYRTSREAIIDTIDAHEYEFDINGEIA